tara:strand:- start:3889 stop:4110 length:222 start_codon:yes stop_codon:yes gene_type:complete
MKKTFLIIFLVLLYNTAAHSATDCSGIKKLSKDYLNCIAKKTKEKTPKVSNLEFDSSNIKEKKYLSDWFKKKK